MGKKQWVRNAWICREGRTETISVIPTAWQSRLFPESGWFRVNAAGVPEPQLLEAVRLHLLPEQDLSHFLRRLSACLKSGEGLRYKKSDIPIDFIECLRSYIRERKAQYGLSDADSNSIHEIAAHARSTCSSASLSNQQAASIVISGELYCLEKVEAFLSSLQSNALVERGLSAWRISSSRKHRCLKDSACCKHK